MSNNSGSVNSPENQPPAWLELIPENLPAELLDYAQFITWQPERRAGKAGQPDGWTKVPINPLTGRKAQSNNPRTWAPAALVLGKFSLLGFVFSAADPFTMIDIDNAIDVHGHIKAWAAEILSLFPQAYWEISTSGTGLKGITRGCVSENRVLKVGDGKVEVFSSGKFTVLTGHRLPDSATTIGDGQAALDALVAAHTPKPSPRTAPRQSAGEALSVDDRDIIERVRCMQRGRALHDDGDITHYRNDHSAADQALASYYVLAGATDEAQLDRLFRSSALMRDKWDERHYRDGRTYGVGTIAKALDGTVRPFEGWSQGPAARIVRASENVVVAGKPQDAEYPEPLETAGTDGLPDDIPSLKQIIRDLTRRIEVAEQRAQVAEQRADTLSRVQSTTARIVKNKALGQERFTAIALSHRFASLESLGNTGDDGLHAITLKSVSEVAGVSEDAASRHIGTLVEAGVLRKEIRWQPERIDPETGEITPAHKRQYIGPAGGNVIDFVDAVANLQPEKPKTWGGRADRCLPCLKHPDAGIVKRITFHCAECGDKLGQLPDEPYVAGDTAGQKPQDAEYQTLPEQHPAASKSSVVTPLISPTVRFSQNHADFDTAGTTVAAAWVKGQALPGMDSHPPDRYTDVAYGARR